MLAWAFCLLFPWICQQPIAITPYGIIEGTTNVSADGFKAHIFLGIPYAKPPINELRYEKPQPPTPWTTPLQAKAFGNPCANYPDTLVPKGKEDCLFMNIVKPANPSPDPAGYPVIVWIHGGAYLTGASSSYNYTEIQNRMVSKGIVFVSINYRLGSFGFFSTGDSTAPGNYGLWDQVQALKFIQQVIPAFGGNPRAVTIMGQSAGGQSVSWLTLSPHAKNLFNRAISMSAPSYPGDVLAFSNALIEATGCQNASNAKECLKGKTTEELKVATAKFTNYTFNGDVVNVIPFHPRIDGEFLYASTLEESIKMAPKRDNLMGLVSMEYIRFTVSSKYYPPTTEYHPIPPAEADNYTREDFVAAVHHLFGTTEAFGDKASEAADKIIQFYESQPGYTRNYYLHYYAQLFGDVIFNIPGLRDARAKAAAGHRVYFYLYTFLPPNLQQPLIDGVPHTTELINFFGSSSTFAAMPLVGDVGKVQKTMVDLFFNFAKNGKPTSDNLQVPPYPAGTNNTSANKYVEINAQSQILDNLWADRVAFWDQLAADYGFDWITEKKVV